MIKIEAHNPSALLFVLCLISHAVYIHSWTSVALDPPWGRVKIHFGRIKKNCQLCSYSLLCLSFLIIIVLPYSEIYPEDKKRKRALIYVSINPNMFAANLSLDVQIELLPHCMYFLLVSRYADKKYCYRFRGSFSDLLQYSIFIPLSPKIFWSRTQKAKHFFKATTLRAFFNFVVKRETIKDISCNSFLLYLFLEVFVKPGIISCMTKKGDRSAAHMNV